MLEFRVRIQIKPHAVQLRLFDCECRTQPPQSRTGQLHSSRSSDNCLCPAGYQEPSRRLQVVSRRPCLQEIQRAPAGQPDLVLEHFPRQIITCDGIEVPEVDSSTIRRRVPVLPVFRRFEYLIQQKSEIARLNGIDFIAVFRYRLELTTRGYFDHTVAPFPEMVGKSRAGSASICEYEPIAASSAGSLIGKDLPAGRQRRLLLPDNFVLPRRCVFLETGQ